MNNVKTTKQVVEIYELFILFCNRESTQSVKQDKKGRGVNVNCSKFARIFLYVKKELLFWKQNAEKRTWETIN